MPFCGPTPADIDRAVRAWIDTESPLDGEFDSAEGFVDIEQLANRIGRSMARQLAERALHRQADAEPAEGPCPQCARSCRLTPHKRLLTTVAGEVAYPEPASRCPACRRDFLSGTPEVAPR